MIITLRGANFSAANIGTLSSWRVMQSLGIGASYDGANSVGKDASFSATVTIADGYEVGSDGVTVTMGGQIISAATISGNTVTINISKVTGNISITVPTAKVEEVEPDTPDVPVEPDNPTGSLDITSKFTFTNGAAIEAIGTNAGKTYSTNLFKYSDYVDVTETPLFEMSFVKWRSSTGTRASLGYALYDADKNYISGYNFELADASVGNSAGEVYAIGINITDPNVKYIRTCFPADESKYGTFSARILEKQDITNMFSFTNGAAIEATTNSKPGETFTTSLFKYSDYVDITEITPFEMSFVTWKSGAGSQATLGYALYDANKNYVTGKRFDLATNSANSSGEPYMITIEKQDSNIKYIRTCYPVDTTKYGEFRAYKIG